jgi:cytochrome P450
MAFYANRFKTLLDKLPSFANQSYTAKSLGSQFTLTADPETIYNLYKDETYTRSALSRRMVEHDGARDAMVSQDDERAAVKRNILVQHLNHTVYEQIVNTALAELDKHLATSDPIDIRGALRKSISAGFIEHLLGVDYIGTELQDASSALYMPGLEEKFEKIFILNYIPLPTWVKNLFSPKLKERNRRFTELVNLIYNQATPRQGGLLEHLLQAEADGTISHDEVLGEIRSTYIGASTLTLSLVWALYAVVTGHPRHVLEIQNSALYSRYAYMESLRLYPTFHMLTYEKRASKCPFHFGKRESVIVSVTQTHRSPKNWDNANVFWPKRFEAGMSSIPKGSYIPFGGGARVCPGTALSMYVGPRILQAFLTGYIVKGFTLPVLKRRIELAPEDGKFIVQLVKNPQ